MYLNYFISIQQILSGPVVSVVYWTIWVVGSNPTVFRINFIFFQIEETCTFIIISSLKYHLKPRANGRNIVGQQIPTLLDVTCYVRLHTLLHVVGKV